MKTRCSKNDVIPIFYACDNAFVKYTVVSLTSLIQNASKNRKYAVYILNTEISSLMKEKLKKCENEYFSIEFVDVKDRVEKIGSKLPLRDYYSKTTYFRMFIADMFPEYDKAVYIDSDTIVLGDIAEFYDKDIKDNYVGACKEQVMVQTEVYGNYVEKVVGVDRNQYFNAGVLLINCDAFRKEKVLDKFINLLGLYTFVVTQDEDYLNVICENRVLWIEQGWNVEVYGQIPVDEKDIKLIHYIMVAKPWHYHDCRLKEYFWKYAKDTSVYECILQELNDYTDDQRKRDAESCDRLADTAKQESKRIDTYLNIKKGFDINRLKILEKIRRFEMEGKFDQDVEDDPETIVLTPDKVDYLSKKLSTRIFTRIANSAAVNFYEKEIKRGDFVIKEIKGIENFGSVKGGAILTCNHFNAYDNYAIWRAIRDEMPKGKRLYKIIREGNFTNFKGLYGFFFRHCNTLPLSSNVETMKNLLNAVKVLLARGEKILIYPEQAMWWNYRKPRPMKSGAFKFAVKNSVPIIPCFITMEDTKKIGNDGFNVQAYTVWFLPPIYPKKELSDKENTEFLMTENYNKWKELYETVYKKPLAYKSEF
jgi:lipopolysaccharide biosynthesis glycosyltransferase